MKILLLVPDLGRIGGIQKYNGYLIRALSESGFDFKVVEVSSGLINKFLTVIRFFWQLLIFRPDKIFCGHINFLPIISPFGFWSRRTTLFTHGIEVWNMTEGYKKNITKIKNVVSVSNFTKNKIQSQISDLNFYLLPNCVDEKKFLPVLDREPLEKTILTIGRLDASEGYKGYELVMEAIVKLKNSFPDIRYLIVGDGSDRKRLEDKAAFLGIQKNVSFLGFVSDSELLNLYNSCSVFAMPSKGEGFGIVFLEALACGKPIIFGNKDGSVEAAGNGQWGLGVNPDSVDDLVSALQRSLDKDFIRVKYPPLIIREQMIKQFGFETFKKRILNFINEK